MVVEPAFRRLTRSTEAERLAFPHRRETNTMLRSNLRKWTLRRPLTAAAGTENSDSIAIRLPRARSHHFTREPRRSVANQLLRFGELELHAYSIALRLNGYSIG